MFQLRTILRASVGLGAVVLASACTFNSITNVNCPGPVDANGHCAPATSPSSPTQAASSTAAPSAASTSDPAPSTSVPVVAGPPLPPPPPPGSGFNRAAAAETLGAAAAEAKKCKTADGPKGQGKVLTVFAPSGNVTKVEVQGPPYAGTAVGECIVLAFRAAKVPPYEGSNVSVMKSFTID